MTAVTFLPSIPPRHDHVILLHLYTSLLLVKDVQSGSRVTRSGKELIIKIREQPWPQLVCCTLICCHMCGCVFRRAELLSGVSERSGID